MLGLSVAAAVMAGAFVAPEEAWAAPESPPAPDGGSDQLQAPDIVSAQTIARLQGTRVEVIGERTETSSTWVNPDGTVTTGQTQGPVWVRTGEGDGTAAADWTSVDLTLVQDEDGSIHPTAQAGDLSLAGGGVPEDGRLLSMEAPSGGQLGLQWTEPLPEPRLDGPRATYENVQPGVDLVVEATPSGYEQYFVLTEKPAEGVAPDLSLTVTATDGLTVAAGEDGGVTLTDAAGVVVGTTSTPTVWDAEVDAEREHPVTEERSDEGTQPQLASPPDWGSFSRKSDEPSTTDFAAGPQISRTPQTPPFPTPPAAETDADAGQADDPDAARAGASDGLPLTESASVIAPDAARLDLVPDAEFLADPQTTYPVVIDPAANFQYGFDTYVQTNVVNTDLSNDGDLRLGTYDGGQTVARSFLNFDLAALDGTVIQRADIALWNFNSWSCQPRNWEVWATDPAGPATRANAQPTWWGKWATSNQTTGYNGCAQGAVHADVTSLVQAWVNGHYGYVGMGLKAENESDNSAWKKFVSAQGTAGLMPTLFVEYDHPPAPPTDLTVTGAIRPDPASGWWVNNNQSTRLAATAHDADGPSDLLFQLFQEGGPQIYEEWVKAVPNGASASIAIPPGLMTDGGRYTFRVHGADGQLWNTDNSGMSGPWTVDTTDPAAPIVASTDYPDNGQWSKSGGQAGNFQFRLPAVDPTAWAYKYALDQAPNTTWAVTNGQTTTIPLTPPDNGLHVLQVQTVDKSGRASPIVKYRFNVGRAGLVSPLDDAQVVRRVRLETAGDPALTYIRYQWRRGPDAAVVSDVPLTTVTSANNSALTGSWTKISSLGGYATWDAGLTLGHVPGPVQVRALMATDSSGAGQYEGPWVTVTVSPDARNAATTDVGPGTANLLTGDYTLSSTDVDEFGLSVVRTASSRDPRSGLAPQAELLTGPQQTISDKSGFGLGNSVNVDRVTNRFHSQPVPPNGTVGQDSLRVTSAGGSGDSFTSILFNAQPKADRTYRVSGWIYVPAATGLAPQDDRGLRLVAYSRLNGSYSDTRSNRPAVVDAWQQISLDVRVPQGADEVLVRLYNGFSAAGKDVYFDDLSVRQLYSPLGPQWELGTADESADTAYTLISQPEPDVAVLGLTGGGEVWFTGSAGKWWPEPGAEGMVLTKGTDADGTALWTLTEVDGTVSTFKLGPTGSSLTDYPLLMTAPPVSSGQTRLQYTVVDGQLRLDRMIAPIEPGVDPTGGGCLAPTPPVGCEVLQLVYANDTTATSSALGNIKGQLQKVQLYATPETGDRTTTVAVDAVNYSYDNTGRLREVWDPRISPALKTTYSYDADGRVTTLTPPGELAWTFRYGTGGANSTVGAGDLIDRSSGRLLSVSRPSLKPGTVDQTGPDTTSTLVYNVPTTRAAGGPYDLDSAALASWAQTNGPTDATALFGPENVPAVTTATATTPGRDGYKPATVHYLDASGREVDTASPAGPSAPAAGYIDSADYDRFGNVTRSLDATNRLLALGQLPTATADLAALGLSTASTADRALALATLSSYGTDGIDLLQTRGPRLRLAVGNDPGDVRLVHDISRYAYDEGKPDGLSYHLVTTTTEALLLAGSSPEQLVDVGVSVNGYNPVDGAPATGPSSGWKVGSPTVVTVDTGTGGANLTAKVRYNAAGKVVESRKIGSNGTDAGTTQTVYYTAGANADDATCGNNPAYAGLACVTRPAGAVTGGDSTRMASALPVKRVTAYNRYGSIAAVTETATGPVAGATVTQERTTTTAYDAADRVTSVTITGSGAGTQAVALGRTVSTYDPASGDVIKVAALNPADDTTVVSAVSKTFDKLGRMTRYDDGAGGITTSTFDQFGKPTQVSDSLGTTTSFSYDRTAEPRGFLTSVTDSVAGTLSATYGPDGQLLTQTMPGGVGLSIGYDANQQPISRTYRRASDNAVISTSQIVENGSGQWVSHTTAASSKRYVYDRQGRVTDVQDTASGAALCTARRYVYNDRAERTSMLTARSGTATCADPGNPGSAAVTSVGYSYDSGDRLVSDTQTGAGAWVYDPLGRITTAPVRSNPGKTVRNAYYANDLVASQTIDGVARQSWTLDALRRFSGYTNEAWAVGGNGQPGWQQAVTKVNHYDSDSDSPAWIAEDASLPNEVTRYVDGLDGNMAVQTGKTGARVLQLIDLHGDVMTTLPIRDGQSTADWTALRHQATDEFGNPTDLTTGTTRAATGQSPGAAGRYNWLGGKQRSADALAGVLLMGVRLYDPGTGRFWSVDPVPGGNATAYDYCSGDPVNCFDLDGNGFFSWVKKKVKKAVKVVAKVAEVASYIPGPIGAAAAGVSAIAYATTGNKGKAIEMALTAAAGMVGAGAAVRAGAAAWRAGGSLGARVGRTALATVRGAAGRAGAGCTPNSFAPDTGVLMADGSTQSIDTLQVGDLVSTRNPDTGEVSAQPVLDVIVGHGDKHLVGITTDRAPPGDPGETSDTTGADSWIATANHPIWVEHRGWTNAGDLHAGDILTGITGEHRVVTATVDYGYLHNQTVYNLSVANTHTYTVGQLGGGTLVHNCSVPGPARFTPAQNAVIRDARSARKGSLPLPDALALNDRRLAANINAPRQLGGHGPQTHPQRGGRFSNVLHIKVHNIHIVVR